MKFKKVCDIFLFLVSNVIINFTDTITDVITAYALCKLKFLVCNSINKYITDGIHVYWALLTIFWIFAPFFLHLSIILLKQKADRKKCLKEAFLHFPLVIPVQNSRAAYALYQVKYSDSMPISSLTKIENIKMVAGKLSQGEAFMVSHHKNNTSNSNASIITRRSPGHN